MAYDLELNLIKKFHSGKISVKNVTSSKVQRLDITNKSQMDQAKRLHDLEDTICPLSSSSKKISPPINCGLS